MPNDCCNYITITCEDGVLLDTLVKNELQHLESDGTYVYNNNVNMLTKGRRGIIFDIWSPNNPNFEWLQGLLSKYPNCWIKNEWIEEGGFAGVWVGCYRVGKIIIRELTWNDLSLEARHYLFMNEEEERLEKEREKKRL
jgi:hypothetical protein